MNQLFPELSGYNSLKSRTPAVLALLCCGDINEIGLRWKTDEVSVARASFCRATSTVSPAPIVKPRAILSEEGEQGTAYKRLCRRHEALKIITGYIGGRVNNS